MDERRLRRLNDMPVKTGTALYWMSRDQRVQDNWALLHAQSISESVEVVFCLSPAFPGANLRSYDFMIQGLKEVEKELALRGIRFNLLCGDPEKQMSRFIKDREVGVVVCDFSPLRNVRSWREGFASKAQVAVFEVDAHNIIPCWIASGKQEFGAYTLRPKIRRLLPGFLTDLPPVKTGKRRLRPNTDWDKALKALNVAKANLVDRPAGPSAARNVLDVFVKTRLAGYSNFRNDPNKDFQSELSPYLHFGSLSAQRVALVVSRSGADPESIDAFLEELIVRRELSDNYCFYNEHYDSFEGLPNWAKATLTKHAGDPRDYLYSFEQFEKAQTHDELWNAAQLQMVRTGKMHGYLRMYWAKKILEWSASPQEALKTAIALNDSYSLDGRDPNGYVGCAWSIGGLHDRPWGERKVFGMVRYMSYGGCAKKFKIKEFVKNFSQR